MTPSFAPFVLRLLVLAVAGLCSSAYAQLVNGQYFTRGLAISNAPAPNSEYTVGGTIGVSVDVSGNGKLPQGSWGPNSTLPSGFISLSLFLISDSQNVTIINGTTGEFLAGEPGSTVKHLNYVIPSCLPEGNYDYTYYEVNRMNGTMYFGITPIPIHIRNPGSSIGACDANITNAVQSRPQNDSAPAQNPFTGGLALNTSSASTRVTGTTTAPNNPSQTSAPASAIPIESMMMNYQGGNYSAGAQVVLMNQGLFFPIRQNSAAGRAQARPRGLATSTLLFALCTIIYSVSA